MGGGLFYNDNAYNFQKVLKDAVAAHGIPAKLYVDNGCSYSNEQLSLICGSIGTVLLHTKVRDGASKAKIERQFRTLKNTSIHSGIGATPLERYQQTRSSIRSPKS